METQVLYAPFVKAADKVKKDVAELSLSDFHPKRFALNYDPPMISKYKTSHFFYIFVFSNDIIVLEYLVPSTGKLYHHKMKLRRLTGASTVKEAMNYLQKRHPLYFVPSTMNKE
jgi:hypothetical protein